jgi:hypothetical protein
MGKQSVQIYGGWIPGLSYRIEVLRTRTGIHAKGDDTLVGGMYMFLLIFTLRESESYVPERST